MPTPPQQPTPASVTGDTESTGALAAAVRVVSGLTLLSRVAGLARDVITARMFGDSALGSAFRAAYALPNVFRRLFGEGALSAAFLPEYSLCLRDDPQRAAALARVVVWLLTMATSLMTGLIMLALFVRLVVWPASDELALSIKLILLMLPMMPAVCLAAILGGMLQAHGRFAIPAGAPILLNLCQIAGGTLYFLGAVRGTTTGAYVVGLAALLATWATVWMSWRALRGKVAWGRGGSALAQDVRASALRVKTRFVPAVLGLGTLQLNTMLDTLVAMWPIWIGATMLGHAVPLDKASNSILSYTQTLYQFPLGVFGIAVATAVFPLLSRSSDRPEEFAGHLRRGLRLSLFIGLPATAGLILVRHDLVAVVFGGGSRSFSDEGLARASAVLLGFAPGVWAYSLNHVLTRAYYAKGDTTTPMRIAIACVLLNVCLNFTFIWFLREAGLAWATATSATVQLGLLLAIAPRRLGVAPLDGPTLRALARIGLLAAIMGAGVAAVLWFWPTPGGWSGHVARLAAGVIAGVAVYAGAALLLKSPEVRWLFQKAPPSTGRDGAAGMSFD